MIRTFNFNFTAMPVEHKRDKLNFTFSKSDIADANSSERFACKAQVLDLKPIPIGCWYDDENEMFRNVAAIFKLSGVGTAGAEYRNAVPLLMNHYGKTPYDQVPAQSLALGIAKNFTVDNDMLYCDIDLMTSVAGERTYGGYIAEYIKSYGAYPMSVGISADDTMFNATEGTGNMLIEHKSGTKDDPDILIYKTSTISEVSFVYQGRVDSAQAFVAEKSEVENKEKK